MIVVIPLLADEPFYDLTTDLDGSDYKLSFMYNQRMDQWYLSIADAAGDPIVRGIAMVCDFGLLNPYSDARLPRGILVVQSAIDNDRTPPGFTELGPDRRCSLVYLTADEAGA